ncbi:hypothetical protein [Microbispora sp. GKU 823]|uniref:hypothetical protein n=1 Tax=Microbispora sp. GKU 823 TaxID=1652100 RepID=UPI00117DF010|nr:hypothetical protein [Microbispora sp. GKU 823]
MATTIQRDFPLTCSDAVVPPYLAPPALIAMPEGSDKRPRIGEDFLYKVKASRCGGSQRAGRPAGRACGSPAGPGPRRPAQSSTGLANEELCQYEAAGSM